MTERLTYAELTRMRNDLLRDLEDARVRIAETEELRVWVQEMLDRYPVMHRDGPRRKSLALTSIISYLRERAMGLTANEVANHFGVSSTQARKKLELLVLGGTCRRIDRERALGGALYEFVKPVASARGTKMKGKTTMVTPGAEPVPHTGKQHPVRKRKRAVSQKKAQT